MSILDDAESGVGARLRAERDRLGLSQEAMGTGAGKNKQTQLRYETGLNSPTAAYLHNLVPLGVDIGYVLTGFPSELRDDEAELLGRFRSASPELRRAALSVLCSGQPTPGAGGSVVMGGSNHGQVNAGPVTQGNVSFQVGAAPAEAAKKKTAKRRS